MDEVTVVYKEEIKVEEWYGEDGDARQAAGFEPDNIITFVHWFKGDMEITNVEEIAELEARLNSGNG